VGLKSMKPLNYWRPRPDGAMEPAAVNPKSYAGAYCASEISRNVVEGLSQLPLYERAALFFRDVERLPLNSVASQLGCSIEVARLHLGRGRVKLMRYLGTSRDRKVRAGAERASDT